MYTVEKKVCTKPLCFLKQAQTEAFMFRIAKRPTYWHTIFENFTIISQTFQLTVFILNCVYVPSKFTKLVKMINVYILLLFNHYLLQLSNECMSETFVRENREVPFKQQIRGNDFF